MIADLPVQLHVLAVILFLILFLIKAFMLFTNKLRGLDKMKRWTKVPDMILGLLILLTGGYLIWLYPAMPGWLIIKVIVVLAAIPLAIVGLKKQHKPLVALSLICFIYVYGVAETKSLKMRTGYQEISARDAKAPGNLDITEPAVTTSVATPGNDEAVNKMAGGSGQALADSLAGAKSPPAISNLMKQTAFANAKQIYRQQCEACHNQKSKKFKHQGPDLTTSAMSLAERKQIILNGSGLMPGYRDQISDQEAEELAAFTTKLK